jgi:hypothetical protein
VTLANLIYFEKAQLPQSLANRLIRLAAWMLRWNSFGTTLLAAN